MSMQLHTEGNPMAKEKAIVASETLKQVRELEQGREREVVFDTHRFVKRLVENGLTEAQASVLADEQVRLLNNNLATAADLAKIDANFKLGMAEIQKEVAKMGHEFELKLAETKAELLKAGSATTKWLIGLLLGSTVTLVTVMLTIMFKILPILNSLG